MPKTTPEPTLEELEAQAAELAARLDELHAEQQRAAEAEAARRAAAEAEFDRQFIATVSIADLEAEANQAAEPLYQALADDPLILALVGYSSTLRRKAHLHTEVSNARMRLGLQGLGPMIGPTGISPAGLPDILARVVDRITTDRVNGEIADLHARRTAAGDDNPEGN